MEKKIEVKNLIISFRTQGGKVQAVRDVSFDLLKGETLAIVGESGSGKSVTNRAIMGISAGNAIIEGGEIIYEGQDLLKISEDDFHKLRGDKIAMIFQDPMSSLNPIMRVGKQLTEAMLLKAKSGSKRARKEFNAKLKLLNENMDELAGADEEKKKSNDEKCKTFDNFCISSTKLESAYNDIYRHAVELKVDIDDVILLADKGRKFDASAKIKRFIKAIPATYHPDIVVKCDRLDSAVAALTAFEGKEIDEKTLAALKDISAYLEESTARAKPNYFTLGFYMMRNKDANVDDMPLDELTKMTREYLDKEFMLDFIADGAKALENSRRKSIEAKRELLPMIRELADYFGGETIDKKRAKELAATACKQLKKAIDRLDIYKNSVEYTFASSVNAAIDKYFDGVKSNPKAQKEFEKQTAKYEAIVKKGRAPDWKVVPAMLVDLELAKRNVVKICENLTESIEKNFDAEFDGEKAMVSLIDWFKEQASLVVYKVTHKTAKAKALKLLAEVGIPEPAIRYNQYPFEFSGGMRQRIVIAIALAANPDVLICDEPTTALDVTIQSQILELINKLKKERNLSVIFITHDLGVVANMADKIAVMYAGKIVEYGTADEVFYDSRHPYTWALLSSMPDLETSEKLDAIPGTPPNMIYPPKGDAFAERNKYALEIDFELEPPKFYVSDTHWAATWLLDERAPKIERPKIITDRIERMKKLWSDEDERQ